LTEEQWVLSNNSNLDAISSSHYQICIEEYFLVIGNEEKGDRLLNRFPTFQDLSQIVLKKKDIETIGNIVFIYH